MFDMKMLDVAIGVMFFFTFASLICSGAWQMVENFTGAKSRLLEEALREIFDDDKKLFRKSSRGTTTIILAASDADAKAGRGTRQINSSMLVRFHQHPLIDSLFPGDYRDIACRRGWSRAALPNHIAAETFVDALLDIVAPPLSIAAPDAKDRVAQIAAAVEKLKTEPGDADDGELILGDRLKRALLWALGEAGADLAKARALLAGWYNHSMDRATSRYRARTQGGLLAIGLIVAVALNLDVVRVVQNLNSLDPATLGKIIDEASKQTDGRIGCPTDAPSKTEAASADKNCLIATANSMIVQMKELGYPIGWSGADRDALNRDAKHYIFARVPGWLLTAFATILGAPFWFDALRKLLNLRGAARAGDPDGAPAGDAQNA